jgi:hypothetical protein
LADSVRFWPLMIWPLLLVAPRDTPALAPTVGK